MKLLTIDGKKYLVKNVKEKNGDADVELIPYDEGEYDKVVGMIADKLENSVDVKMLLKEVLSGMSWKDIMDIHRALKKGKKPRKMKKGCCCIPIGKGKSGIDFEIIQ